MKKVQLITLEDDQKIQKKAPPDAKFAKYLQSLALLFILVTCMFSAIFTSEPALAKSFPSITVHIDKNPITKHMYFAPSFPPCIDAQYVKVKFVNDTNSRATIQTDTGSIISVPPHAKKYAYYYGYASTTWTMLESNIYGGNAYIYLNSCF